MRKTPTLRPSDELLTTSQAARELGITRQSVYLHALAGRLPARLIAGSYIIRRADLDAFRAARMTTPTAA